MTKSCEILSIIPARAGSKGLHNKNIIDLLGKPLISWTIEASLKSKFITKTIVSSDSDEILKVSKYYGAHTIKRPNELSEDNTPTEPVVRHVLESLKDDFDFIILLQPTSPLRDYKAIDSAIELLFKQKENCLISVVKVDNKILKSFIQSPDGKLIGIHNDRSPFINRQDLPSVYSSNGAIYIINTSFFLKKSSLFIPNGTLPFIMDSNKSLDIDSIEDLKLAEIILKNK
tara:strand:+ start:24 stop:713 length:690 start_codon:yes stop_codon:yes gene_type:complete